MKYSPNKSQGFSIVELLIVLLIVLLVASFALLQIASSKNNLEMQNVSSELKVYLERARFDSVKRNASSASEMANLTLNSSTSFTVRTDLNQNGKLENNETREIDFSYQDDIKFFNNTEVFPIKISFNNRGKVTATNALGNIITPTFLVCRKNCEEVATSTSSFQIVNISPTGTVTILNGDEVLDVAATPQNVTTSTTSDIRPMASNVPNDGSIFDILTGK